MYHYFVTTHSPYFIDNYSRPVCFKIQWQEKGCAYFGDLKRIKKQQAKFSRFS
jgi:hypothetical protein